MNFKFGNLTTTTKLSTLKKTESIKDFILYNNFDPSEDEYYLFLLEGMPDGVDDLAKLKKKINEAGYSSYIIAAATNTVFKKEEVKQQYEYIKSVASNWKSLINYQGVHVTAIMPFGAALYAVNKGTDLIANEFYETKMMKPYYYLGHGFIGDYDTFIFPVDSIDAIYPKEFKKGCPFDPMDSTVNFKTRFFYEQLKNMLGKKELPDDMRPYKIVTSRDEESAKEILTKLLNSDILAWDTETGSDSHKNGLLWYRNDSRIHCFTMCNDGETGYYIEAKVIFNSPELRKLFCEVMYTCSTMVGANIKFDLHYLMKMIPELDFYKIKHIDDTGQLLHAMDSDVGVGLKASAFRFTYFGGYDDELDVFKKQTKVQDYSLIPFDILYKYATLDAIVTYRIFVSMVKHLEWIDANFPNEKSQYMPLDDRWNTERWYEEVMTAAYPCFVMMEHNGMRIDRDYMLEVRDRLQYRIPIVTKELCSIWNVPLDFKFGSPTALGKQIEKMGWPKVEESKAGGYATNDDCIKEWERQKQPGIKQLIEWRLLNSLIGTFIGYEVNIEENPTFSSRFFRDDNSDDKHLANEDRDQDEDKGWEYFITYHPEDKSYRIHQSYKIMGTTTYRCIGKDPNLQNIPVHEDIAHEIMRCITVPTAMQYTIECNGEVYIGGSLDTVEVLDIVENQYFDDVEQDISSYPKRRISLADVKETDTIVPGSLQKFTYEHEECFEECKDNTEAGKTFIEELIRVYGSVSNKWRKKYGGKLIAEDDEVKEAKVETKVVGRTPILARPEMPLRKVKK